MCKIFRFFTVLFIFILCVYILNWVNRSRILEHTMATGTTGNTGSVSENSQPVDRTLKPLYLKNSDIQTSEDKRLSDYDLIDPIMRVIGDDLHCLQLDRNLWRIYLKTLESRNKLLTQGIEINDISASFYDTNPYSSGATSVSQQTLKIRICGLPLSVDESAVHEMLNKLKVKLTSKILYEKIRHPVTNKMTSILNGTRFMYIEPLPAGESLPKFNTCAGLRCKILHFGQPKNNHILQCTNCWKTGHTKSICKNDSCCKVCQKPGHLPGQKECPHYEVQKHIAPFSGSQDVLSNFYPCELDIYGVKHKSAEHAFQYTKAIRCGDLDAASKITAAEDALSAMRLGKKIKTNEQWNATKEAVMEEIIENKSVQVKLFQEKIRSAKQSTTFVETTYNDEWGSGLDRTGTINTKQDKWPGKNTLGTIIKKVAKKVRKRKLSDNAPKAQKQNREQAKQRNIVDMLKTLRAASDSDASGCNPDSESSESEGET